ncbi:glycosyltransferase [Mucilaginibacter robiniae]|uniref:Glycosyltransferase n=1 Tax=Mucilaginibacter robiniae TaxID=2728022 RepID=A0A7L5E186_9SPHI|nr:glycosyltransferase [Mucilaginibacter robiniae]QJD96955.1 glycosyltransferase [Mucilaginibacter robiniae]
MKILHIVPSYKPAYIYGGPIESVARLCEGLVADGHEVQVYTTTANGKTELEVPAGKPVNVDGVQVTYFPRITKDPTHVSPALWKQLYQTVAAYDVIHIHSWWNILVMVAAKISLSKNTKVVVAPRGMLSQYIFNSGNSKAKKLMHKAFGKSILAQCYFHATSGAEYRECEQLIPGWKGFELPNIIALPATPVQHQPNRVFTIVFLSRVHPKKGLELLFEAISGLHQPVVLRIAGTGDEDYIQQLKQLSKQLNISNQIEWLGWKNRDEKFTELMDADLFALVSLNENFANVVVEALHMGTAVLLSKDVALSEFVAKTETGWVSQLDVESIRKQLTAAINNVPKREYIRQHGRAIIEKHFSEKQLISQYVSAYKNLN